MGRVRTPSRQTGGTQNPQLGQDGRAVQNTWNKNLAQNLWDILGQQEMRTIRMYTWGMGFKTLACPGWRAQDPWDSRAG